MLRARGSIEGAGGGKAIKDAPRPGRPLGVGGGASAGGAHVGAHAQAHTRTHTHTRVPPIDDTMSKHKMHVLALKPSVREIF